MIPLIACAILAAAILAIALIDRGLPNCARAVALYLLHYAARADTRIATRRLAHYSALSTLAHPSCDPPPFLLGDPTLPTVRVSPVPPLSRNRARVNGQSTQENYIGT